MEDEELMRQAKKRVKIKRSFYSHLVSYVTVNAFLAGIAWLTGSGYWFLYVTFGWGIGMVIHAVNTYMDLNLGDDAVQKEMEILKRKGK